MPYVFYGTTHDRFIKKVALDPDTGCWNWTAYLNESGYGRFGGGERSAKTRGSRKTVPAHRWSYEHYVGKIPEGLHIDHLCKNTKCVNPNHLEPVTPAENTRRSSAAEVRRSVTHCKQGHPFSGENLRVDSEGRRKCVACRKIVKARSYQKSKRAA